ncbi:hypothetical protein MMC13_001287 [Lambiella insularis]|nr:hypothetical protein [Lambiella insularis]
MPTGFKDCVIAVTGDFGSNKSHDKIKKWIETQSGRFVTKISADVTHLVPSKEHFKRQVAMVQEARKLKKCHIVSFDWLEDSLMIKRPKRVGEYLMKAQVKAKAKAKAKKKVIRDATIMKGVADFEKGCDNFKSKMHTDGYHIYRDSTGFAYDITLVRSDLAVNINERYSLKVSSSPYNSIHIFTPLYPYFLPRRTRVPLSAPRTQCLQLYESHAPPMKYACFTNYSSPLAGTACHILAPAGSGFLLAFGQFMQFFKLKTKLEWNERNGVLGSESTESKSAFVYKRPKDGEPWGLFEETYHAAFQEDEVAADVW